MTPIAEARKGERTRRRIVELAAPVFNQRGYSGASMRDLVEATGLEKGGIYNHFGSKEALALAAFDHALGLVTERMASTQDADAPAADRLVAMIEAFASWVRDPGVPGGCPILNTAVESDDTNPQLRDAAQAAMTSWHRLIGSIVKRGLERDELDPATDRYALSSFLTAALEGAVMLSSLYGDPTHMDRVVAYLVQHVESLRRRPARRPSTEEH